MLKSILVEIIKKNKYVQQDLFKMFRIDSFKPLTFVALNKSFNKLSSLKSCG